METKAEFKRKYEGHYLALNEALKYSNMDVMARFLADYKVDEKTAKLVFKDMIRFLWLDSIGRGAIMYQQMQIVDEMWHTFVLFSEEYESFCKKYFKKMIYHVPEIPVLPPKGKSKKVFEERESEGQSEIHNFIDLVYVALGPTVANRWFVFYPENFPMKKIKTLRK